MLKLSALAAVLLLAHGPLSAAGDPAREGQGRPSRICLSTDRHSGGSGSGSGSGRAARLGWKDARRPDSPRLTQEPGELRSKAATAEAEERPERPERFELCPEGQKPDCGDSEVVWGAGAKSAGPICEDGSAVTCAEFTRPAKAPSGKAGGKSGEKAGERVGKKGAARAAMKEGRTDVGAKAGEKGGRKAADASGRPGAEGKHWPQPAACETAADCGAEEECVEVEPPARGDSKGRAGGKGGEKKEGGRKPGRMGPASAGGADADAGLVPIGPPSRTKATAAASELGAGGSGSDGGGGGGEAGGKKGAIAGIAFGLLAIVVAAVAAVSWRTTTARRAREHAASALAGGRQVKCTVVDVDARPADFDPGHARCGGRAAGIECPAYSAAPPRGLSAVEAKV